ncbi:unnamed protein product [Cylindrotheca closterium]|uniref:SHSP domain-containing protein n=1 Tax=Cylindrotheca closterium TaxID=2856 RepID=A0AAD2FQP8_9STRA|nr:unnamed protein product [Cylindrotheca closterium]
MKTIAPTILALASAPAVTSAWSSLYFPVVPSANTMMRRNRAFANQFFQETQLASPRYELIDNEDKFQLSVDVPGVKMEDIDVSLEDGHLTVSGQRLSSSDNSRFASKFSQTFSLDPAVDVDQFSASLDNGVLVVAAPKDMKRIEENIKKIPVMQGKSEAAIGGTSEVEETSPLATDDTLDLDTTGVEASGDVKVIETESA